MLHPTVPRDAQSIFASDIVYVTGQELCFTYLRDNIARSELHLVSP